MTKKRKMMSLRTSLLTSFFIESLIPIIVLLYLFYSYFFQPDMFNERIAILLIGLALLAALSGQLLSMRYLKPILDFGREAVDVLEDPDKNSLSAVQYAELMETSQNFHNAAIRLRRNMQEIERCATEMETINMQLTEKMRMMHALQDITGHLLQGATKYEIMESIFSAIEGHLKITSCLWISVDADNQIHLETSYGLSKDILKKFETTLKPSVLEPFYQQRHPVPIVENPIEFHAEIAIIRSIFQPTHGLLLPLITPQRCVGMLLVGDKEPVHHYNDIELSALKVFSNFATLALEVTRIANQRLQIEMYDGVTNLFTYNYFQSSLTKELDRSIRFNHPLSLFLIDLDGFRQVNEVYGHKNGDLVLQEVARTLKSSTRTVDYVARYGADEFAIIMPETKKQDAMNLGERLRQKFEKLQFDHLGMPTVELTACIGLASYPEDANKSDLLVGRADRALEQAKQTGQNNFAYFSSSSKSS